MSDQHLKPSLEPFDGDSLTPVERMLRSFEVWTLETDVIAGQFIDAMTFGARVSDRDSEMNQERRRLMRESNEFTKRQDREWNRSNWDGDARLMPNPGRKVTSLGEKRPLPMKIPTNGQD